MLRIPAEPILAKPATDLRFPPHYVIEPKWDGYRALLARRADGRVQLRSRRGTDLTKAFPDITAAAADLPPDVLVDGELVVWEGARLAFERLQQRMNRAPATAARLAAETPAHMVAFDLLYSGGVSLIARPYRERRQALEELFAEHELGPPWTLCPATTVDDTDTLREWLTWTVVGVEGVVIKNPAQRYLPGAREWRKYRVRDTTEAVIGAVTGSRHRPETLLLGRLDADGRLHYAGRTTPLSPAAAAALDPLLLPARPHHPWEGRTFTAGWGSREPLHVALAAPELVAEVDADVALDAAGRWRHPVRFLRPRPDLTPCDTPRFGTGNEPATG